MPRGGGIVYEGVGKVTGSLAAQRRRNRQMAPQYHRRVIRISAEDSPNVQLAQRQKAAGITPTDEVVVPGVLTWGEYQARLATWDIVRQTIGLRGEFYEGQEVKLFPQEWLAMSNHIWTLLPRNRKPISLGCDPGEGDADSAWSWGDDLGLIGLYVKKTPRTDDVQLETIRLATELGIPSNMWVFDRGGGGLQHCDTLRRMGYACTTVGFGEGIVLDPKRGMTRIEDKKHAKEERYAYVNRRAQMYGELSDEMDPSQPVRDGKEPAIAGYAIPPAPNVWPESFGEPPPYWGPQYAELLRQLSVIPKWRDNEGRLFLPKKSRKPGAKTEEVTMESLLGRSPDHADSCVLMLHRVLHKVKRFTAGSGVNVA